MTLSSDVPLLGMRPHALHTCAAPRLQVDINEVEPAFLKGCTTRAGIELSPVRVVKNPDGAMQRAAMTAAQLARDRRELKQQQQKAVADAIPKNMGLAWLDPMAGDDERHFADELRQVRGDRGTLESEDTSQ